MFPSFPPRAVCSAVRGSTLISRGRGNNDQVFAYVAYLVPALQNSDRERAREEREKDGGCDSGTQSRGKGKGRSADV